MKQGQILGGTFAASVLFLAATACHANVNPNCSTAYTSPTITIQNGLFQKNGNSFRPRGLQIRGYVASLQIANAELDNGNGGFQTVVDAQNAYARVDNSTGGRYELEAAANPATWNANVLRFQVSQPSLDPSDTEVLHDQVTGTDVPFYNPDYLSRVLAAIDQARCAGFVVIVSMQDEAGTGTSQHVGLPTQSTVNAWMALLPHLYNAPDVLFELYNEPSPADDHDPSKPHQSSTNWNLWESGGTLGSNQVIGMQTLLNTLRRGMPHANPAIPGAQNVMLLDGLAAAASLSGIASLPTPITDTVNANITNQFAYAVHPYPRGVSAPPTSDTPAQYTSLWDYQFGNLSASAAVITTEWSASAGESANSNLGLQGAPSYQIAVDLLNYLVTKRIPLSAGAFDIPGIMIQDLAPNYTYTPSNYDDYANVYTSTSGNDTKGNENGENAGILVQKIFNSPYPTTVLTCANGVDAGGSNGSTCGVKP